MSINKSFYPVELPLNKGDSGQLVVMEHASHIPFLVKRAFIIANVPAGKERGNHANIHSQFFMVCLSGSCKVTIDDGICNENFLLDKCHMGLYMDKMKWKTMSDFSEDCILLVLSDCLYDKSEYISDYDKFRAFSL